MLSAKLNLLHLIVGEIGGVGKSWFCKMLIEAYISLMREHYIVDCDETTPNVGRAYDPDNYDPAALSKYQERLKAAEKGLKPYLAAVKAAEKFAAVAPSLLADAQALLRDHLTPQAEKAVIEIKGAQDSLAEAKAAYEQAKRELTPIPPRKPIYFISEDMDDRDRPSAMIGLAMERDTIVNLPAQVTKVVNSWIRDSGLLSMTEDGLDTICWFVAKPTKASIEQLIALHDFHEGMLKIVLVKNNFVGHAGNWNTVLDDLMLAKLDDRRIVSIDIQDLRLNEEQRYTIDQEYAVFSELIEKADTRLLPHEKAKIRQYLNRTIATIVGTGLIPLQALQPVEPVKVNEMGSIAQLPVEVNETVAVDDFDLLSELVNSAVETATLVETIDV
jgi:hypothetical protein